MSRYLLVAVGMLSWTLAGARLGSAQERPAKPARVNTTDALGDPLPEGALARMGTTRLRPMVELTQMTFTPDGKALLSVGVDNSYRLWDAATGKELRRFKKPGIVVTSVLARARNQYRDYVVAAYSSLHRGSGPIDQPGPSVASSADGRLLALMDDKTQLTVWDTVTHRTVRRFDLKDQDEERSRKTASGVAFSSDGKTLAVNLLEAQESFIYLLDVASGKQMQVLKAGKQRLYSRIVFAPDGKTLLGVRTKEICAWSLATGKRIRLYDDHEDAVTALAFAPGGKQFASASMDKTAAA